ncbi:MAG TPA: PKD domain-containing protein [Tepidisphaeraceae bacterium]|nr:PKD domain-containing protein [Tepidisphaeraceae bacterium]
MAVKIHSRRKKSLAARKLRSAIESLENRLLLTVATDANGWTQVMPTPGVSRLIYVSSSTGSDANAGTSPSAPVASIAKAYSLIRNNEPDWILFARGDTFAGSFSYFGDSGISSQQPIVITNYGDPTLPRPVIDAGNTSAFRTGSSIHDVYILGVSFTSSTHNPTSPNFNDTGSYGFYDTGGSSDILIEDCQFSYFINDITFTDVSGPMSNITVRRNEILDAYSTSGHAQGLYADTVTNLTITDNVFDHDGWNADVPGGGATIFNHDCYLHSSNVNCVVTGNVFADAGSFGLQARAGGIVENNLFIGDPYGFAYGLVNGATTTAGGVSGTVSGNVVMEPRIDAANGWGIGAMIGNLAPGGNTVISNNIFSGEPGGNEPAIIFEPGTGVLNPQQEVGINSVTFENNTTYDWGFGLQISNAYVPGSTGSDGLTGVVIKNNNFQDNVTGRIVNHGDLYDPRFEDWSGNTYSSSTTAQSSWFTLGGTTTSFASWVANIEPTAIAATVPFNNPNETIESYMTSQGLPASEAAFVAGARAQNEENWNPVYFATTVNGYIQAGYVVVAAAPTATAVPPADVTPANYLSTPTPTFAVAYADVVAINASSITSNSVTVAGAGGVSLPVTLISATASGPTVTATYQVSAPGGDWTTVPYGTYVISVVGGQVQDTAGLSVGAVPLASFGVSVNADANPVTSVPTAPVGFAAIAGTNSIGLSWADPAGDQRSFILERALDAGFTQSVQTLPLTADATSYTDNAVAVGTTYYYELIAVNPLGQSAPTAAISAAILPPAPALSRVFFNDGNAARVAITSATLLFTQPVTVTPADLSLSLNSTGATVPLIVSNPSGDGKTWIVNWTTSAYNNRLPDGTYSLTVHGGLVTDAFGQSAGGDQTTTISSSDGPVVTATSLQTKAPPHSISMTFSQDVSASLSISSLVLGNSQSQAVPAAGFAWNPATLTATWTYAGALPDGNYSAQLIANGVTNADGVHLDGNKDGIPGDTYIYNFTVVKPTLSISGASNVNVGATYNLTLGTITDAGQTNPSYLVHWGDGTTSTATAAGVITHSYATDGGPTTISVDVIDANGTHASAASLAVSINRATVALSGKSNANPGATYTLNLGTVTDPGFVVSSYIVHWGDGSSNTYTSETPAPTHVYTNSGSASAKKITVDLVDNSGSGGASYTNVTAATLGLTVNAYPFVSTTGVLNANVGGNYTLFFGTPVDNGFTVSALSVNWGDGSAVQNVPLGTTQLSHVFLSGAPASDAIRSSLTDNSGTYSNASVFTITVNPRPTVPISGNPTAGTGSNYALTVGAANDPAQTVSRYTVNWGDGTSTSASAAGVLNHTYTTAGTDTISVDLTDGAGTYTAAGSMQVTVNALTPTISIVGNPVINGDNPNGLFSGSGVQRSMVEDVVYTFSAAVTIANANQAFTVVGTGANPGVAPTSLTATPVAGTGNTQWAVTLTGAAPGTLGSLANGEYSITINPAFVLSASDGITPISAGRTDTFYRLYGDINGDRVVNAGDNAKFKTSLSTYNPAFDFNGDGTINAGDNLQFKKSLLINYSNDGFVPTI